ncbi:acyl-CoA dehydrogenase family protein [Streptomyces morookaense]|uniref:Acyl-CoA dehydrogenase family protein n=1 Tax=Streptomyces morookaense TaxID=1970 RepID=A0A7Y7BBI6_STRMO|nr:acyl-CoA dehydrogenase family protein [Streptomyces morookaense]NVK82527.1 acyl-CoA dehydrogenase family protein [Streptomyces morookaense]GHF22811.1 acyl-CoA dehydrogenase [Streptomyces morookaense]
MSATHEVFNQAPPLTGFTTADDPALLEALRREGGGWGEAEVRALGARAGSAQVQDWARLAEANPPVLHTHDRYGHRIDEVEFHPAWHELMAAAVETGQHAAPWADARPGAHLVRAAKFYVWAQAEPGHGCPVSMTYAAVPALRAQPELAAAYEPLLASRTYDHGLRPPLGKQGLIAGMSMTEKQGGSDVRANTTTAVPAGDGSYTITGHKWFTSAPMSDVFLVLAQAEEGLTCFLMPRVLPDGTRNAMRLQRLKDKLGNRSNASAEIEYEQAVAWPVGEPGRGVRTIVEMVNMTRLDCVLGSAAGMRAGLRQAVHHAAHRRAFGAELVDQPLMRNVLADLAVESEAATLLAMRLAAAVDRSVAGDAAEAALRRLALAAGKYWVCKRGSTHAAEALECLGGNGYVEESGMPRLYREAPLLSIWEGSGNVAALDVLRVLQKEPAALDAWFAEVGAAAGADARLDAAAARVGTLLGELSDPARAQLLARRLAEQLALVLQGSLLVRHGDPAVADAFCASRLGGDWGNAFGTLPAGADLGAILARASVKEA